MTSPRCLIHGGDPKITSDGSVRPNDQTHPQQPIIVYLSSRTSNGSASFPLRHNDAITEGLVKTWTAWLGLSGVVQVNNWNGC